MDYKKTKTINKQGTIIRNIFLSVLLLFLLNVNGCGGRSEGVKPKGSIGHSKKMTPQQEAAIRKLKDDLGGWGPCTGGCFLGHLRADAKTVGAKEKVNGVKSYGLPKHAVKDGAVDKSKTYFQGLLGFDIVGSEEGRKEWKKLIRENKQNYKFQEGLSGVFSKVAMTGLESKKSFKRAVGVYVVYQYMEFIDKVVGPKLPTSEQTKEKNNSILARLERGEIAIDTAEKDLENAFNELKAGLEKVGSEGAGIRLVIPVGEDDEIRFEDRESERFKRRDKHVLTKEEAGKFEEINKDIENMIKAFVQEYRKA